MAALGTQFVGTHRLGASQHISSTQGLVHTVVRNSIWRGLRPTGVEQCLLQPRLPPMPCSLFDRTHPHATEPPGLPAIAAVGSGGSCQGRTAFVVVVLLAAGMLLHVGGSLLGGAQPSPSPCHTQIRFARFGRKYRPFYRLVAIDSRARRDGRPLEVCEGGGGVVWCDWQYIQHVLVFSEMHSTWAGTTH